jgi:hypothetical protein
MMLDHLGQVLPAAAAEFGDKVALLAQERRFTSFTRRELERLDP